MALALLTNEIDLVLSGNPVSRQFIDEKKLNALGVGSLRPYRLAPGVPLLTDTGIPGFESRGGEWRATMLMMSAFAWWGGGDATWQSRHHQPRRSAIRARWGCAGWAALRRDGDVADSFFTPELRRRPNRAAAVLRNFPIDARRPRSSLRSTRVTHPLHRFARARRKKKLATSIGIAAQRRRLVRVGLLAEFALSARPSRA